MASTKVLLSGASVILVVLAFVPNVMGIKCYQCNSFEDKGCENIIPSNTTRSPFLKECDTSRAQNRPIFCRKIIQHIMAFQSDETRVIRKCSYEKSDKDCYHFEDEDHTEVVCQCFSDACNGAERSVISGTFWRTSVPAVVATVASYVLATRL